LQRADRLAVVAVLGVVVVLDHERVAGLRPREQRGSALGRERPPSGDWCAGVASSASASSAASASVRRPSA
jgi:hypothetical protein